MLLNPKTVSEIDILTAMYDSKHVYFESRFFCSNDTGISRVSNLLYRTTQKELTTVHHFPNYRFPFYKLSEKGIQVVESEKRKDKQKDNDLRTRVKTYLQNNEGSTSKEISRGIKKSFNNVIKTLRELSQEKVIYMEKEENKFYDPI